MSGHKTTESASLRLSCLEALRKPCILISQAHAKRRHSRLIQIYAFKSFSGFQDIRTNCKRNTTKISLERTTHSDAKVQLIWEKTIRYCVKDIAGYQ